MADDGRGKQKRLVRHTACFTTLENALLLTKVDLAGVSISAFLRSAALDFPLPANLRHPRASEQHAVRLLAEIGRLHTVFHEAVSRGEGFDPQAIETAMHDFAETRLLLFEALGLKP
jgi:hypothetical protein